MNPHFIQKRNTCGCACMLRIMEHSIGTVQLIQEIIPEINIKRFDFTQQKDRSIITAAMENKMFQSASSCSCDGQARKCGTLSENLVSYVKNPRYNLYAGETFTYKGEVKESGCNKCLASCSTCYIRNGKYSVDDEVRGPICSKPLTQEMDLYCIHINNSGAGNHFIVRDHQGFWDPSNGEMHPSKPFNATGAFNAFVKHAYGATAIVLQATRFLIQTQGLDQPECYNLFGKPTNMVMLNDALHVQNTNPLHSTANYFEKEQSYLKELGKRDQYYTVLYVAVSQNDPTIYHPEQIIFKMTPYDAEINKKDGEATYAVIIPILDLRTYNPTYQSVVVMPETKIGQMRRVDQIFEEPEYRENSQSSNELSVK